MRSVWGAIEHTIVPEPSYVIREPRDVVELEILEVVDSARTSPLHVTSKLVLIDTYPKLKLSNPSALSPRCYRSPNSLQQHLNHLN